MRGVGQRQDGRRQPERSSPLDHGQTQPQIGEHARRRKAVILDVAEKELHQPQRGK